MSSNRNHYLTHSLILFTTLLICSAFKLVNLLLLLILPLMPCPPQFLLPCTSTHPSSPSPLPSSPQTSPPSPAVSLASLAMLPGPVLSSQETIAALMARLTVCLMGKMTLKQMKAMHYTQSHLQYRAASSLFLQTLPHR